MIVTIRRPICTNLATKPGPKERTWKSSRNYTLRCPRYILTSCSFYFINSVRLSTPKISMSSVYRGLLRHQSRKDFRAPASLDDDTTPCVISAQTVPLSVTMPSNPRSPEVSTDSHQERTTPHMTNLYNDNCQVRMSLNHLHFWTTNTDISNGSWFRWRLQRSLFVVFYPSATSLHRCLNCGFGELIVSNYKWQGSGRTKKSIFSTT